jgi:hypothetical protein
MSKAFPSYYLKSAKEYFHPRITRICTNRKYFLLKTHKKSYFTTIGAKIPLPTLAKAIVRKPCDQENKILAGISNVN